MASADAMNGCWLLFRSERNRLRESQVLSAELEREIYNETDLARLNAYPRGTDGYWHRPAAPPATVSRPRRLGKQPAAAGDNGPHRHRPLRPTYDIHSATTH